MNKEIHIICELNCRDTDRAKVGELVQRFVEPAKSEAGCLYYDAYYDQQTGKFYILDGWQNQAAVDTHVQHPNVAQVMSELRPLLTAEPKLTLLTRLAD